MADDFKFVGIVPSSEGMALDMETLSGTDFKDLSGNLNHGVPTNITTDYLGGWGKGAYFNGTNSVITVSGNTTALNATTGLTLMAWIRTDSTTGSPAIIYRQGAYSLVRNGLNIEFTTWSGLVARTDVAANALTAGKLTHVAATYDSSYHRIYIDGELKTQVARSGNIDTNTNALYIGLNSANLNYWLGMIDETYVFRRPLSVGEIQAVARAPLVRLTSPNGSTKVALRDTRTSIDVSRTVTISAAPGNRVIDVDLNTSRRQFTISGKAVGVGALSAQEEVAELEKLVLTASMQTENSGRSTLHIGKTEGDYWKTYKVRFLNLNISHDTSQTGGSGRIFDYSLSLAEGGQLTITGAQ